jgi:nucleotide-binding universal stress UspA family protein
MAEIIPFRRAKKNLERKKAEKLATEHRIAFGRTKADKLAEQARKDQIAKIVDGARLPSEPDEPTQ